MPGVLAGILPKVSTIVAQHGLGIAAGVVSGAIVGGAGIATGVIPAGGGTQGAPSIALLACPGSGPQVARLSSGQRTLITAKSADGAWLLVYVGAPGVPGGWAPAAALRAEADITSLPVSQCGTDVAVATALPTLAAPPTGLPSTTPTSPPSLAPTVGPTAIVTPKPTKTPKPTPKPTSYKDPNPPMITSLTFGDPASTGPYCDSTSDGGVSPELEIYATDKDNADSTLDVELYVDPPGPLPEYHYTGAFVPHLSLPGDWSAQWQPSSSWTTSGVVKFRVTVTDPSGNTTSRSSSSNPSDPSWIWWTASGSCPTPAPS